MPWADRLWRLAWLAVAVAVVLLDHGRVVLDAPADDVRGTLVAVHGPAAAVEEFVAGRAVRRRRRLGSRASVTVAGPLDAADEALARALRVDLEPLSLQQLLVQTSGHDNNGEKEAVA